MRVCLEAVNFLFRDLLDREYNECYDAICFSSMLQAEDDIPLDGKATTGSFYQRILSVRYKTHFQQWRTLNSIAHREWSEWKSVTVLLLAMSVLLLSRAWFVDVTLNLRWSSSASQGNSGRQPMLSKVNEEQTDRYFSISSNSYAERNKRCQMW